MAFCSALKTANWWTPRPERCRMPKPIRCLYADPEGDLWIGYAGAGLGRIRDGKFSSISTEPRSARRLHLRDDLWTTAAVSGSAPTTVFFRCARRELNDALSTEKSRACVPCFMAATNPCRACRAILATARISCAAPTAASGFRPAPDSWSSIPNLSSPNHLVPPVVIEQVLVDGQPIPLTSGSEATLPPRHRKIEIAFTALEFYRAGKHRLPLPARRLGRKLGERAARATQCQLSRGCRPGEYVFHVTACNNAGIWNDTGATLAFTVEPFRLADVWFRLSGLFVLLGSVALAVRYYFVSSVPGAVEKNGAGSLFAKRARPHRQGSAR